jgi:hypothetical protein
MSLATQRPVIMMGEDIPVTCLDCGEAVDIEDPSAERTFALTPEIILCYACAVRRGGVYDDAAEKWKVAPNISDIVREQSPAP